MSLEAIANIASIIASIAVVLTLIFIALQMRQTLQVTKMSAAQSATALLSQNYGRIIEFPEMAELFIRLRNEEELSEAEQMRVSNFAAIQFRYFEMLHAHVRAGIFDDDLWAGALVRLHETLDIPRIRTWWDGNRTSYAPSFIERVDKVYAEEARKDGRRSGRHRAHDPQRNPCRAGTRFAGVRSFHNDRAAIDRV